MGYKKLSGLYWRVWALRNRVSYIEEIRLRGRESAVWKGVGCVE